MGDIASTTVKYVHKIKNSSRVLKAAALLFYYSVRNPCVGYREMYDFDCPWFVFDYSHRLLLGSCLLIFGITGLLLNSWLFATFLHSHLLSFKSHILVLNICCASLTRGALGGFPFSGSSAIAGRWMFGSSCCQMFAFLNQLLGVFQMSSLTALCIERYLNAKYFKLGKELSLKFYMFCIGLCWFSAVVFAVPPLVHFGAYRCDISKTICTLDWRMRGSKTIGYNIPLILIGSLVPVTTIFVSLWKAFISEKKILMYSRERFEEQRTLTKCTIVLATTTLLFWLPQAVLTAWITISSFMWYFPSQPPVSLVMTAALASESATILPILCYLVIDPRIRTALLGRCKRNYGIIKKGKRRSVWDSGFQKITQ